MSTFSPVLITSIDIDKPLPRLAAEIDPGDEACKTAWVLTRLHGQPLGIAILDLPAGGISSTSLAQEVWKVFETQIKAHLAQDGFSSVSELTPDSLATLQNTACLQRDDPFRESEPFVSIVISTRDRAASLRECLQSILDVDYSNYEIIIVDNAPKSPETEELIRSAFAHSPRVHYVRENVPGLAIAHNRALLHVTAPIVVFTDDDVIVDKNWLKFIVAHFIQDPKVGCVTGLILPYEIKTPPQLWIEQYGGFSKGYQIKVYDLTENRPQDFLFPYSAGKFGSGANMAFRTSALIARGGFDPALGAGTLAMGGDDLAAFFDVIVSGERLVYEPAAILYHKHRGDYPGLARQAYGYGVGLSAFLMSTVYNHPARLLEILLKVPAGLKFILDPRSSKNQKKKTDYPRELTQLELKGFLFGPIAYLRSRWRTDKLKAQLPRVNAVVTMNNHLAHPTGYIGRGR